MLQLNQIVRIEGDEENNEYKVCGSDPTCGRFWLCAVDEEYDGYNGDLIVEVHHGRVEIVLCDSRCSLSHRIRLIAVRDSVEPNPDDNEPVGFGRVLEDGEEE